MHGTLDTMHGEGAWWSENAPTRLGSLHEMSVRVERRIHLSQRIYRSVIVRVEYILYFYLLHNQEILPQES